MTAKRNVNGFREVGSSAVWGGMQARESRIQVDAGELYLRHNGIVPDRDTLLFIHGLGDSGRCFDEVFRDKRFSSFNILVPDMLGYGRSSDAGNGDYRLKSQVKRIWELIEKTGVRGLSVIGHSMGGDLSTLLCQSDENRVIRKHVNIEGDITQYDDFITKRASEAEEKDNFENWFVQNFMEEQVSKELVKDSPLSGPRYYESLKLCRLPAFKANALELYDLKNELDGQYTSRLGEIYASLDVPQMFCLGTKPPGPDKRIIQFLTDKELDCRKFREARHWVMIDQPEEFYSFLLDFLSAE